MTFKVCVCDSGSQRGIIAAMILHKIFQVTGRHPTEIFDLFIGTSTGTIVISILNVKNVDGTPKYSTQDLIDMYKTGTTETLQTSYWRNFTTMSGLFGPRCDSTNRDNKLNMFFEEVRLKESIKDIVLLSYDLITRKPVFFKTRKAKLSDTDDFLMKDLLKATTSAPSIFAPFKLGDMLLTDAIYAKNPTIYAIIEANRKYYKKLDEISILSLGSGHSKTNLDPNTIVTTGTTFLGHMFDSILSASNDLSVYITSHLLNDPDQTLRLCPELPETCLEICDPSKKNLDLVILLTEKYIEDNIQIIEMFAKRLVADL